MLYIYLKSYNFNSLNHFSKFIRQFLLNFSFNLKSFVNLPLVVKKYTVNRSPHVFSKSKEQFELRIW